MLMLWSKSFIPTLREAPQEAESIAHRLMLRAGLARMLVAGVYSYLPLGLRVLTKIEQIKSRLKSEYRCGAGINLIDSLNGRKLKNKRLKWIIYFENVWEMNLFGKKVW